MKTIQPGEQPRPKGHYSPGILHNGVVYVSGQLPMDMVTRQPVAGAIEEQTELALRNVEAVLYAACNGFSPVLQNTIYVSDIVVLGEVYKVLVRILGGQKPASELLTGKEP